MDSYPLVVSIISTIVFGLEFIASIIIGSKRSFGFPLPYLSVSCICGTISQALIAAAVSGAFSDYSTLYPRYWYAMSIFSYVQILMLFFLPVLAIYSLSRKHNKRINGGDIGGSYSQVPKPMVIMVYVGFVFVVIALALFIASLALAGSSFTMLEFITYGQITIASSMIMWFFILFWIVAAISHRSIQLQSPSSFIGYGILITLPMIISTAGTFSLDPLFVGWRYIFFFLDTVPLFFATGLALIYAQKWTEHPEQNGSQPI